MPTYRTAFVSAALAALVWAVPAVSSTSAQPSLPSLTHIRDRAGRVWLVDGNVRHAVPLVAASDDQLAAIAPSGSWAVPKADGSGYDLVATSPIADGVVTVNGTESMNSEPLTLGGGAYTVEWRSSKPAAVGSYLGLESAEDATKYSGGSILNGGSESSGMTRLYNVKPGRYYVGGRKGGDWTVTITPLPL